jgi:LmbE family N-acetylglucosaminyl deacetylase
VTSAIVGNGTPETDWAPWLADRKWPQLDLNEAAGRRIVVLAAHPDDEVLGAGGLMMRLAAVGHPIVIVWATDGEASHPGSTVVSADQLRSMRREESRQSVARLGVVPEATHHLMLPDGRLDRCLGALRDQISDVVCSDDVVLAPWSQDGHPDHEAVGAIAGSLGSVRWQYPIWMWHWATPGVPTVPWAQVRAVEVPDVATKAAAIAMFASQVEPIGPDAADAAILPPHVVARFTRRSEWIFV